MLPPRRAGCMLLTLPRAISIPRPQNDAHWLPRVVSAKGGVQIGHQSAPEFSKRSKHPLGKPASADIVVIMLHHLSPSRLAVAHE